MDSPAGKPEARAGSAGRDAQASSPQGAGSTPSTTPCPRCGALNGKGFDRCIRCNAPLSPLAEKAEALSSNVDGSKLWGTKILTGLTLLVFAGQLAVALGGKTGFRSLLMGGKTSDMLRFGAMYVSWDEISAEPWRLLSAVFVHFGVLHFVMNMAGLGSVGRVVEPAIGAGRLVVAYLVTGVLGFGTNLAIEAIVPNRGPVPVLTAGASGAIFGVMGLTLGWLLYRRDKRWRTYAIQAVFYAVILLFMGIKVNVGAHLGGLAAGAALGFYFAYNPRPRSHLAANLGAVIGLILSIASLVLAQRAAGWGKKPTRTGALDAPPAAACASVPPTGEIDSPPDLDV